MIRKGRNILFALAMSVLLSACMTDFELMDLKDCAFCMHEGMFIINEGNFMYGNASLSYFDVENGLLTNDVFYKVNALPLGDVAQSMTIRDSTGYIVMNNSGKIHVINTHTFAYMGKITGLTSPRHIHIISEEKAYITDLYSRSITIVNPTNFIITGSIDVRKAGSRYNQHSTDQMVQLGKYVFVSCWSFDNQILVIDSETDRWVASIEVPKQPSSMVADRFGKLWVVSDGGFPGSPYGYDVPALTAIDARSWRVIRTIYFEKDDRISRVAINGRGDMIYLMGRDIYRHPVVSSGEPELFIRSPYGENNTGGFRAIAVDPETSDIYVADAIDHVQHGIVYRFLPSGMPLDTLRVGIIPGAFCFKPM
jgi:glutamine cyclotransferase